MRQPIARLDRLVSVGEADAPSAQPLLEKSILSLKEFDDDQLMAMNPTSGNHQQK